MYCNIQLLTFKCRLLKNSTKISSIWFWNNAVKIKITPNGEIYQIFHATYIETFRGRKFRRLYYQRTEAVARRPANLLKKRLWHKCFPVNFEKFLRTPFFIEHLRWLLLKTSF